MKTVNDNSGQTENMRWFMDVLLAYDRGHRKTYRRVQTHSTTDALWEQYDSVYGQKCNRW